MDREFKGVWIPSSIYLNKDLTPIDKFLFAEIDSFTNIEGGNGCFASNKFLADFCNCSERKISDSVSKLISMGLVEQVSFNGRERVLRSRVAETSNQTSKNCDHINIDNQSRLIKEKEISKDISQKKRFITPTVEEVRAYCKERHNNVNAEQFVDYYSAKGWLIGKNKMKDWKAAVRLWERNDSNKKSDTWSDTKLPTW